MKYKTERKIIDYIEDKNIVLKGIIAFFLILYWSLFAAATILFWTCFYLVSVFYSVNKSIQKSMDKDTKTWLIVMSIFLVIFAVVVIYFCTHATPLFWEVMSH